MQSYVLQLVLVVRSITYYWFLKMTHQNQFKIFDKNGRLIKIFTSKYEILKFSEFSLKAKFLNQNLSMTSIF